MDRVGGERIFCQHENLRGMEPKYFTAGQVRPGYGRTIHKVLAYAPEVTTNKQKGEYYENNIPLHSIVTRLFFKSWLSSGSYLQLLVIFRFCTNAHCKSFSIRLSTRLQPQCTNSPVEEPKDPALISKPVIGYWS